jgi:hypothetical protein
MAVGSFHPSCTAASASCTQSPSFWKAARACSFSSSVNLSPAILITLHTLTVQLAHGGRDGRELTAKNQPKFADYLLRRGVSPSVRMYVSQILPAKEQAEWKGQRKYGRQDAFTIYELAVYMFHSMCFVSSAAVARSRPWHARIWWAILVYIQLMCVYHPSDTRQPTPPLVCCARLNSM